MNDSNIVKPLAENDGLEHFHGYDVKEPRRYSGKPRKPYVPRPLGYEPPTRAGTIKVTRPLDELDEDGFKLREVGEVSSIYESAEYPSDQGSQCSHRNTLKTLGPTIFAPTPSTTGRCDRSNCGSSTTADKPVAS